MSTEIRYLRAPTPDDVIVITCPGPIHANIAKYMQNRLRDLWPDNKIVILSDGNTLHVESDTP